MSLPPEFIQVKRLKRKAADEDHHAGAVDYLRFDDNRKRHRCGEIYIYQRKVQESAGIGGNTSICRLSTSESLPVIHASKPGDENLPSAKPAAGAVPLSNVSAFERRRFHLSRDTVGPEQPSNQSATGKRSRHKACTTLFVERGQKRTRIEDVPMPDTNATPVHGAEKTREPITPSEPARKQKLPGSDRKRAPTSHVRTQTFCKQAVPESLKTDRACDMVETSRKMNDLVLQHISENLAKIEERDRKTAFSPSSLQSFRFKPKAPSERYANRHRKVSTAAQRESDDPPGALEEAHEMHSEDEYVNETYVRIPVTSLGGNVNPERIGFLVFDNEPEVDFFYDEQADSDDNWPDGDEDENAEDYYTADYPDDELDSDDEYGRHTCGRRNASETVEYDEREHDLLAIDYYNDIDGNDIFSNWRLTNGFDKMWIN